MNEFSPIILNASLFPPCTDWWAHLLWMLGAALLGFLIAWLLRKAAINRLRAQKDEKEAALNQLTDDHSTMKGSYEVLQSDYNQLQDTEQALNLKLGDTSTQLNSLENRYAVLSREKVALNNKLESLEQNSRTEAEYQELCRKHESSLAAKQSDYDALKGKYNALLAEQKDQQTLINNLQEEKGKMGGMLDNLQSSLAQAKEDAKSAFQTKEEADTTTDIDEDTTSKTEEIKVKLENTTEEIKAKLGNTWADVKKRLSGLQASITSSGSGNADDLKQTGDNITTDADKEPFWDTPIVELVKGNEENEEEATTTQEDTTTTDEDNKDG